VVPGIATKENIMAEDIKPQDSKSPKDAVANQLRETFTKEWQTKLKEQTKKAMDARKIAKNETAALKTLVDEYEQEKADFNSSIKELF
jgi:hypothetical protein